MSLFQAFVSLLRFPFRIIGWVLENWQILAVISVLINATVIPFLAYIVLTDSVNVLAQAIGVVISRFSDSSPNIVTMADLRGWIDEAAIWLFTNAKDINILQAAQSVCVCVMVAKQVKAPRLYLPEKAMPGSSFVRAEVLPTFQASVMELVEGAWREIGQCFRLEMAVVTARHVVKEDAGRVRLQSGRGMLEIEAGRFEEVDEHTDLAYAVLDEKEWARLGLAKAKLHPAAANGEQVLFVSAQTSVEKTSGCLSLAANLFGFVRYTGSTRAGFSGAPYAMGNKVYGMHLGASSENIGYDAGYILMKLRGLTESSTDYFEKLVDNARRRGRKLVVRNTGDPDVVEVFVKGHYVRLDRDLLEGYGDEVESATYSQESASQGNGKGPRADARGPGQKTSPVPAPVPSGQSSPSTPKQPQAATEEKGTESPASTPVPSSSRSPTTSASVKPRALLDQQGRLSKDVLTVLSKLSANGGSGLNSAELKLLRQYANSTLPQHPVIVSSAATAQPTVPS